MYMLMFVISMIGDRSSPRLQNHKFHYLVGYGFQLSKLVDGDDGMVLVRDFSTVRK